MNVGAIVRTVLRMELLQLARDRRAVFSAVLLPAFLYPLIFWSQGELEDLSRETLASREVHILTDLDAIEADLADEVRAALERATPIQVSPVDADVLLALEAEFADDDAARRSRRAAVEELRGAGHLLVTAEPHPGVPRRTLFRLYFDVKDDVAREARERAQAALDEVRVRHERLRRAEILTDDPARGLDLSLEDVASEEDKSGAALGTFLPLIAVLVLLSGGAYAALAVFAGEREAGTLETLLVQPVPARSVTWGKFAAVLLAGLITLFANLASLGACIALGVASVPGSGIGATRLLAGVVYLPGCVLLCAVLCLVCGKARTFREGQQTILPVMLATLLPTAIALQPGLEHNALLAMIPFAGPALSLRDALRGELTLVPTVAMFASHALWSWLVLSRLANLLDAERVLSTASTEAESARRHLHSRHALRWAFALVLVHYVIGGRLQAWNLEVGLALSLWVVFPAAALLCARRARRTSGAWLDDLRLARPASLAALGAVLCVPALVFGMRALLAWQETKLPLPRAMSEDTTLAGLFDGASNWKLVFLFAISPAVCEELFFRGALLSGLRRDLGAVRAVLWQALFFAAAHASVHRLLPTGVLGILLGALTLRTKSIWPAVVLHLTYNALVVLDGVERIDWPVLPFGEDGVSLWSPHLAWLAVPGLLLILRRPDDASR